MGQTGSKVINKISSSLSFSGSTLAEGGEDVARTAVARFGCLPLVYSRRG